MTTVKKRNIASLIMGMFASMRVSGLMEQQERMVKKNKELGGDPHKKLREEVRREKNPTPYREGTTYHPTETGKRQAERIQRQINRGQLKEANGLSRNESDLGQLSKFNEQMGEYETISEK